MNKTEGEIAGLEALANATPEDLQLHIARHDGPDSLRQNFVVFRTTVVEQLDFELVARPVERCCRGCDTHSQPSLVADRELHQNPWESFIRQMPETNLSGRRKPPD